MIKNILWVEDFDTNDSGVYDSESYFRDQIQKMFGNKYSEQVELQEKVYCLDEDYDGNEIVSDNLLQFIDDNIMNIDCVVLDINLKNGIPKGIRAFNKMKLLFEKSGVVLPSSQSGSEYSDNEMKKMAEEAGFYVFLYLVLKGFPYNRIIINTAYENKVKDKQDKFIEAGIKFPEFISKNGDVEYRCAKKIDEMQLFSGHNIFYCIKNIVFSAIQEYTEILKSGSDTLKSFNNNMQKEINKEKLYDLFDEIKRIFCQNVPLNHENICEKVYRSVLKIISEPFESPWESKNSEDELFTYQRIMKILRNWCAHNKFSPKTALPNESEFLILFVLSMRSYFGVKSKIFDFEKIAFGIIGYSSVNMSKEDKYRNTYLFISKAYKNINSLSLDYIEFLDKKKGRDDNPKCSYSDLLKGLWAWRYGVRIDFIPENDLEPRRNMPIKLIQKKISVSSFCNELMKVIEKVLLDAREINKYNNS